MSKFEYLKDPTFASNFLAQHLRDGTLTLFLGAGISKGFGLPSWIELVNSMRKEVSLLPLDANSSADDLQRGADEIIDKISIEKLISSLKKHLYTPLGELTTSIILEAQLLVAISALMMGGKRGHVRKVITLNYDNLLEWVLSVFGFSVKTIYDLPALESAEDVTIYHPHGFIPYEDSELKSSSFIILGMDSANERIGTPGDPWFEMTRHLLNSSVCLFIGLSPNSLSDRALAPLFSTTGKKVSDSRPLGIWLVMEKEDLSTGKIAEFHRNNIYPIEIKTPEDIANFVLNICKKAGEKLAI